MGHFLKINDLILHILELKYDLVFLIISLFIIISLLSEVLERFR